MPCAKKRKGVAAVIKANLVGADGWVLMEYRGSQKLMLDSRTTEAVYVFTPGTMRYVDAFDVGMLYERRENDEQVFFEVDE